MKNYVKALFLAPVALIAFTACEAKMSSDKAKERADGYDTAVLANYESVTIKVTAKDVKTSGYYDSLKDVMFKESEETNKNVSQYFCSEESLALIEGAAGEDEEDGIKTKTTVAYYSYKKTGLKVVVISTQEGTSELTGAKVKGKTVSTSYILDDGRVEKTVSEIDMKSEGEASTSIAGMSLSVDLNGTAKGTLTTTYTWNAAA